MSTVDDLTGQRFGRLVVIRRAENKGRRAQWLCRCDCNGKEVVRQGMMLKRGSIKSCGCLKAQVRAKQDLTGQRFGRLVVIRRANRKTGTYSQWLCRCDCDGKEVVCSGPNLRQGHIKSCGCLAKEHRQIHFGKGNIKKELKSLEIIVDETGAEWYSLSRSARYLKVSKGTLYKNWKFSCPALNGAAIVTRQMKFRLGRLVDYYSKASLDEVKKAPASLPPIPVYAGWVYVGDAADELHISVQMLGDKMKAKNWSIKKKKAKDSLGRINRRSYITVQQFGKLKAELAKHSRASLSDNAGPTLGTSPARPPHRPPGSLGRKAQAIRKQIIEAAKSGNYSNATEIARIFRRDPSGVRKTLKEAGIHLSD